MDEPDEPDVDERAADDLPEPSELSEDEKQAVLAQEPVVVPIGSVLDLHSFLPAEVESVVETYLEEAVHAGLTDLRIIHGRGIGVQREIVRAVLARSPWVISYRDAPATAGGWGATIATIARLPE